MARFLMVFVFLLGCKSTVKEDSAKDKATADTWAGDMQNMSRDVRQLVPFIYDREAFQAPGNREAVRAEKELVINGYRRGFAAIEGLDVVPIAVEQKCPAANAA